MSADSGALNTPGAPSSPNFGAVGDKTWDSRRPGGRPAAPDRGGKRGLGPVRASCRGAARIGLAGIPRGSGKHVAAREREARDVRGWKKSAISGARRVGRGERSTRGSATARPCRRDPGRLLLRLAFGNAASASRPRPGSEDPGRRARWTSMKASGAWGGPGVEGTSAGGSARAVQRWPVEMVAHLGGVQRRLHLFHAVTNGARSGDTVGLRRPSPLALAGRAQASPAPSRLGRHNHREWAANPRGDRSCPATGWIRRRTAGIKAALSAGGHGKSGSQEGSCWDPRGGAAAGQTSSRKLRQAQGLRGTPGRELSPGLGPDRTTPGGARGRD